MSIPTGFTGSPVDRADHLRLDEDRMRELSASLEARLLRLSALDPMLDEDGRLGWTPLAHSEVETELIFLGFSGETPLFAPLTKRRN